MAQIGRRGSLKNCIVKVRVLLPALLKVCGCGAIQVDAPVSEAGCWRFKSSHPHQIFVGVAQLAEREFARLEVGSSNLLADSIFFCTLGRVDYRRRAAAPVRAVRFRQRAPNGCRSGASGRRAELKPPFFGGSSPPFGITVFCGWASAQLGLISLDLLGALPRPAIR